MVLEVQLEVFKKLNCYTVPVSKIYINSEKNVE